MASVKEERITEMVGGDYRSRPYYHRKCKGEMLMIMFNSLPDELLFEILIRLPAQDIYDNARFVCRKWSNMIHNHDFVYAHFDHTSYGILFHSVYSDKRFMALKHGQIKRSMLRKYTWAAGASCNGLVLDFDLASDNRTIYVKNPVTKYTFVLPPLFRAILDTRFQGLAFAAASMEYKVVSTCLPSRSSSLPQPYAILTVGVDKSWRIVRTDHLSFWAKVALASRPHITEGFMHWTRLDNRVLTLNVETEIVVETPPPIPQHSNCCMTYLSGGRYLSLLINCGGFSWEVWEMKPESGVWRKLELEIAVKAQKLKVKVDSLTPYCWLKYLEVLVFGIVPGDQPIGVVYNVRTQGIESIELPFPSKVCRALVHKSSLLWLPRC